MWTVLADGQRTVAKQRDFALCQRDSLQQGGFTSIAYARTKEQTSATITIASTTKRVAATAITAVLSLEGYEPQTRIVTMHWFVEDGAWHWALDSPALDNYRSGRCPTS